ncbi:hypothetical protein HDV57DRAFT_495708 [Trichoderma longibrachiatum]
MAFPAMTKFESPILMTGAAVRVGGVGMRVVTLLQAAILPVRGQVRQDDNRAVVPLTGCRGRDG